MPKSNCKCKQCGEEFYKKPSKITENNYCSKQCHYNSMKKGTIIECLVCGIPVYRAPSELAKSKTGQIFCSKKCQAEEQNGFGASNYNYKGKDVQDYRVKAFRFKEHRCNRCGYNKLLDILQVHHIDSDRSNNDLSNLEILCPNCHCEEHYVK